mmetsp:Transcript_802/g.2960  ORF Transcript_802/g.2960 Transcript_802/m.2960 type:complete len:389 (-) Transcript_802:109-1275(-)
MPPAMADRHAELLEADRVSVVSTVESISSSLDVEIATADGEREERSHDIESEGDIACAPRPVERAELLPVLHLVGSEHSLLDLVHAGIHERSGQEQEEGSPTLVLDNKYYSAAIHMRKVPLPGGSLFSDKGEAVVLHCSLRKEHTVVDIKQWWEACETDLEHCELRLLCADWAELDEGAHAGDEAGKRVSVLVEELLEWSLENAFEMIQICSTNLTKDLELENSDDMGLKRIYSALQAHMWPGLVLKRREGLAVEGVDAITEEQVCADSDAPNGQSFSQPRSSRNNAPRSEDEIALEREHAVYSMLPSEPEEEDEVSRQADEMDKMLAEALAFRERSAHMSDNARRQEAVKMMLRMMSAFDIGDEEDACDEDVQVDAPAGSAQEADAA